MSRPTRITVNALDNAWEGQVNSDFQQLYDRPIPILLHAGDLTSLEAAWPAASYDKCLALCDYDGAGTPGEHMAFSNGTAWKLASNWELFNRKTFTPVSATHAVVDLDDVIVTTGGGTFDVDLPALTDAMQGRVLYIKHQGSGTITLDPAGADTIDGDVDRDITVTDEALYIIADPDNTDWIVFAGGGGGASAWLGLSDTPASYSGEALKYARVNSGESAMELVIPTLLELSDAPSSYAGDGLKLARVNTGESALEFVDKDVVPLIVAIGDEITAITTGTAKVTFRMPYAFTLTDVRSSLTTASSSGLVTVDINESGSTILSTKLTIDATEKTSTTAAAAVAISDAALADDAEITIDIDVAGSSADAVGLKVTLIGRKT